MEYDILTFSLIILFCLTYRVIKKCIDKYLIIC